MKQLLSRASVWWRSHGSLAGAFACVAVVVALYGRSVHFAFYGDDPSGHFRFIEQVSWQGLFTSTPGFFVRPLVFVVYKLLWFIFGGYSAPVYHLVPLFLHIANALLLGVLGSALSGKKTFGWLAALLFAAFPLNHEAVASVDALAHPLLTFWILLALVLYLQGRRTGRGWYFWAVQPVLLLALLTHENSLILPGLILAIDFLQLPPQGARDLIRKRTLQYFVLPALFLIWWSRIPKGSIEAPRTVGAVLHNTLPFVQLVAYPTLPIIRIDANTWGWLLVLAALALLLTWAAARSFHAVRAWIFAVAWLALTAAPAVLFLDWGYLTGAPHLYYLSSVGAALLWSSVPVAFVELARGPVVRRGMVTAGAAILALFILTPPIPFVGCQVDLDSRATDLVRGVGEKAILVPPGRGLVFVNLPVFITSAPEHPAGCTNAYPFVATGTGVFLTYADLGDFIRVNSGMDRPARGVTLAEYGAVWPPRYGTPVPLTAMRELLAKNQVYVFDISTWSLRDLSATWVPDAGRSESALANYGDSLSLVHTDAQVRGNKIVVTLDWRVDTPPPQSLTAFIHVYDRAGKLLAQNDAPPGQNGDPISYVPFSLWQGGDRLVDVHTVVLPSPLPAEGYSLAVGVYNAATVKRLSARSTGGASLPNDLYTIAN